MALKKKDFLRTGGRAGLESEGILRGPCGPKKNLFKS